MSLGRQARRRLLLVVAAIAAVALTLSLRAGDALETLELDTVDARFELRGEREPRADIVMVALDSRSISELEIRPPLNPRRIHARVLDRLAEARPRLVVYDFQFINPSKPARDRRLVQAVSRARPVVLATHDNVGAGGTELPPLRVPAGYPDPSRFGARLGGSELITDRDGKIRRVPYASRQSLGLSVVAAEAVSGAARKAADFPAWIDYRGPPGSYPAYPFVDVVRGAIAPGAFTDKIVVVGATDPVYKDVFPTPMAENPMSGAEVHANALDTILSSFPLAESGDRLDLALIVAFALLVPLALLVVSAPKAMLMALAGMIALAVGSQVGFNNGTIVEFVYPVLALVVGSTGGLAVQFLTETRDRTRMRAAFSRFVPDHVVEDVMQRTDEDFRLGSATVEATVMFCDLRGFTGFAESHSADTVIDTLNRYLTEMSDAILERGGTVVSYMGDGIMAVFGAPVEQEDHADRAVAAAVEMLATRLATFNDWVREQRLGDGFRIGIGICTGAVRSGNVGSERRLEYAAVGDTTNVAARLQGQCKHTPYQLLIAESTRDRLGDESVELVFAGEHMLTGRTASTRTWTVPEAAPPDPAPVGAAETRPS